MGNPQLAMTHRARAEPWSESTDQQGENGERRGSGQRLKMHLTSLALHLDALRFVIDGRGTLIHVALTARGQLYSGPSPGLEKAQSGQPEGEEKRQSPGPRSACGNQRDAEDYCDRKGPRAEKQTAAPLAWTDVRRAHGSSVQCSPQDEQPASSHQTLVPPRGR